MFSLDGSAGVLGDRYWRVFSIWASNTAVTRHLSCFRDMGMDELLLSRHLTPYNCLAGSKRLFTSETTNRIS